MTDYTRLVSPNFIKFNSKIYTKQIYCHLCGEPMDGEMLAQEIELECNCRFVTGEEALELYFLFLSDLI